MDATQLVLPAIIMLTALALVMSGIAIVFQIRRDRLPDATRYENVRELRAQAEALLADRRQELSVVEQKIQQRDRLVAEVASLEQRLTAINAELATLDDARREIEQVKAEAAAAAGELATVSKELKDRRAELEAVEDQLSPERREQLRREIEQLGREREEIVSQLLPLRAERDAALQRIEEAKTLDAFIAARKQQLETLAKQVDELEGRKMPLEAHLERVRSERDAIASELARLRAQRHDLQETLDEMQKTAALAAARSIQLEELKKQIEEFEQRKGSLEGRSKEFEALGTKLEALKDDVARLDSRKARLEQETGGAATDDDPARLLEDLTKVPAALEFPSIRRQSPRDEVEALHDVERYLQSYNLKYSRRTINAFHTAIKINDFSQLTVLAGVSGTGKSLLPRRYAEAMGIHFLQIAVEPRWDSPQDLLGFYNYIEKNYRATDLARLLVHMNPYEAPATPESDLSDHIALVLLDEMNLARVEYYFSEFLSRLEARPRYEEASDKRKRADAMIPIDIRGLRQRISLFPSHSVLFVGTMNDDESTQSLSDKVLDRSNILQFAAPVSFGDQGAVRGTDRPAEAQSFKSWRGWIRPSSTLNGSVRSAVDGAIERLARIMEEFGRPFGHRLRDAIIAYVASYPDNRGYDYRAALVDQIEYRILPKLRGLEIDSHRPSFDALEALLREELQDAVMADRIAELRTRQAGGTGLFVWRGLTR
ncbi:AAA family ATPase [Bradyrhizobium sp. SZCCHNR2028]|uniref:AAA family ATPase n=1 Tax=Bradyrhizobium sp. SZCCHNR2028 TaxID=3057382 RepID=UPI0028EDE2F4|nr:AAA family ATPase [Bradyrhizobium sp. SZCCHNR2028]